MQNNKTIEWLNGKVMYRVVKVMYILVFLFSISVGIGYFMFEGSFKKIDGDKTIINCNSKQADNPTFSPDDARIKLDYSTLKHGFNFKYFLLNSYNADDIIAECYRDKTEALEYLHSNNVFRIQKTYEIGKSELSDEEKDKILKEILPKIDAYGWQRESYLDFSPEIFTIIPEYKFNMNIIYIILGIIIFFETVRRLFYYIILGRIFPIKK
jgi:hypothetical protein